MKRFVTAVSLISAALVIGGLSPIAAQSGPKNFVSPTYRAPAVEGTVPHEMTKREANRLVATAELPADHLRLMRFYNAEADGFDAQAAAYEEAAAALRNGPFVRNFMSPTAPARYEFKAEHLREESDADRRLAASHEREASLGR